MHDIADFLKDRDPFAALAEAELEQIATRTEVEYFAAGETIFAQGDPPPSTVRIVRRGEIALVRDGRVLDLLGEGELLGHPSMLSGLPTGFEARAVEDTLCYRLDPADVIPLLARPSSLPYLSRSLLARGGVHFAGGNATAAGTDVALQTARALVRRQALICTPEVTVREAARRMVDEGVSSMLIRAPDGSLGIVTDHDLRSKVVAEGLPIQTPVSEVMTCPVTTIDADRPGADVMLAMLDADIRHLPVLSGRSEVVGVLTDVDLVAAEAHTPFILRRTIAQAADPAELGVAAARLRATVIQLHGAGISSPQIGQVITVVADALIGRMIELAIAAADPAPIDFSWISLGSHGRREALPSSDVDSGIAWPDQDEADAAGAERYAHAIAEEVAGWVQTIGWRLDAHGVTASGSFSAHSISEWHRLIGSWLSNPSDERVLVATSILLDARTVYGSEVHQEIKQALYDAKHGRTLERWMLKLALATKAPTGFQRNFVIAGSGERRKSFDVKHSGLLPIVNIARYSALRAEARTTSTLERLRTATEAGVLEQRHARTLAEAFELFSELRLDHQVEQLRAGVEPDDELDPMQLDPLTRRYLRDAFREVAAVQKTLSHELRRSALMP